MRLTIKSKLAGAFGLVIVLSMVAGGVAYDRMDLMSDLTDRVAAESHKLNLARSHAARNPVGGEGGKEHDLGPLRMPIPPGSRTRSGRSRPRSARPTTNSAASRTKRACGCSMRFRLPTGHMTEGEARIAKFAIMNSNNKALSIVEREGSRLFADLTSQIDRAMTKADGVDNGGGRDDLEKLERFKTDVEALWGDMRYVLSVTELSQVEQQSASFSEAEEKLRAEKNRVVRGVAGFDAGSATALGDGFDAWLKSAIAIVETNRGAGNIQGRRSVVGRGPQERRGHRDGGWSLYGPCGQDGNGSRRDLGCRRARRPRR